MVHYGFTHEPNRQSEAQLGCHEYEPTTEPNSSKNIHWTLVHRLYLV